MSSEYKINCKEHGISDRVCTDYILLTYKCVNCIKESCSCQGYLGSNEGCKLHKVPEEKYY